MVEEEVRVGLAEVVELVAVEEEVLEEEEVAEVVVEDDVEEEEGCVSWAIARVARRATRVSDCMLKG